MAAKGGYFDQDNCPECGSVKYVPQETCYVCLDCSYSPCS